MRELKKQYGDNIRIVFKHFPVHGDRVMPAHLASCAAMVQGKFWEFEELIWTKGYPKDISEGKMLEFAGELKLNIDQFKADMASDKCKQDLNGDMRLMQQVGVSGTPAFYINGRPLGGAAPIDGFKAIIDQEIKKFDQTVGAGKASPETYYQKIVVEGGKKKL